MCLHLLLCALVVDALTWWVMSTLFRGADLRSVQPDTTDPRLAGDLQGGLGVFRALYNEKQISALAVTLRQLDIEFDGLGITPASLSRQVLGSTGLGTWPRGMLDLDPARSCELLEMLPWGHAVWASARQSLCCAAAP